VQFGLPAVSERAASILLGFTFQTLLKTKKMWRGDYHYTRIQHNDSFSPALLIQLNYNRNMLIQLNRRYIASYMFVEIPKLFDFKRGNVNRIFFLNQLISVIIKGG
jgi:hypothetical protein